MNNYDFDMFGLIDEDADFDNLYQRDDKPLPEGDYDAKIVNCSDVKTCKQRNGTYVTYIFESSDGVKTVRYAWNLFENMNSYHFCKCFGINQSTLESGNYEVAVGKVGRVKLGQQKGDESRWWNTPKYFYHRTNNPYPTQMHPSILFEDSTKWNERTIGERYHEFLDSDQWNAISKYELEHHPQCYYCENPATQVHHDNYMSLQAVMIDGKPHYYIDWNNRASLKAVCDNCHKKIHDYHKRRMEDFKNSLKDHKQGDDKL